MSQKILPLTITDSNFTEEVEFAKNQLVIVDFWAPWCGPCLAMEPIFTELSEKYKNSQTVKIGKVNVDDNENLAEKFSIRSIPTTKFFFNGQEIVEDMIGAAPKEALISKIEAALEKVKN